MENREKINEQSTICSFGSLSFSVRLSLCVRVLQFLPDVSGRQTFLWRAIQRGRNERQQVSVT